MITSINFKSKTFTFSFDGVDTEIAFPDLLASDSWKDRAVVQFNHKDSLGRSCSTTLARNAFTDNLAFNNKEGRGEENYENDKNIFLLYRVLDGETKDSASEEVANLETIRSELDAKKQEYKDMVNDLIIAHVEKEESIPELAAQKEKVLAIGTELAQEADEEKKRDLTEKLALNIELENQIRLENKVEARPDIPPMDFSVSKEMQKVVLLVQDESKPKITFKNVSLNDLTK